MKRKIRKIGNMSVRVIEAGDDANQIISQSEREMDKRAVEAVRSAIKKAKVCEKPVAKYDARSKKAYVQNPDGVKVYVK